MPQPRNPKIAKRKAPPTQRTAMLELAAAFGHGARKGKRMLWSVPALQEGEDWLMERFAASTKDYWRVRDEAVRVAYIVGGWAATIAQSQGLDTISDVHMKQALARIVPPSPAGRKILREDCPF